MSAGISHELNQPLSAIQNYAENTKKLIDRDRGAEARANLSLISEQIQRMGRIIVNLRSFARKETEPLEVVDIGAIIDAAIALSSQRAKSESVTVHTDLPPQTVQVEAGHVRLQQVIVNLLSNAMDAMAEHPQKSIWVELACRAGSAHLVVRDTGPGLAEPSRAFEPFYTTKEIGASKGLGLGLSISYGIIVTADFDGVILSDIRMPGKDGFDVLARAQAVDPDLRVLAWRVRRGQTAGRLHDPFARH